jgi:hypothetical protein
LTQIGFKCLFCPLLAPLVLLFLWGFSRSLCSCCCLSCAGRTRLPCAGAPLAGPHFEVPQAACLWVGLRLEGGFVPTLEREGRYPTSDEHGFESSSFQQITVFMIAQNIKVCVTRCKTRHMPVVTVALLGSVFEELVECTRLLVIEFVFVLFPRNKIFQVVGRVGIGSKGVRGFPFL